MSRQAAGASGRMAETIAAHFLRLNGWTILAGGCGRPPARWTS